MADKVHTQGKKPKGVLGCLIGILMNVTQTAGHYKTFIQVISGPVEKLLDIGCGGGAFLNRLAKSGVIKSGFGLDHSDQMVRLAKRKNRKFIQQGLINISKGSAEKLTFKDNDFSVITAFETIQYWPKLHHSISEIYRILEPNGHFVIINRYPDVHSPWYNKIQIKNETEYKKILKECGFTINKTDITQRHGWIMVDSIKK